MYWKVDHSKAGIGAKGYLSSHNAVHSRNSQNTDYSFGSEQRRIQQMIINILQSKCTALYLGLMGFSEITVLISFNIKANWTRLRYSAQPLLRAQIEKLYEWPVLGISHLYCELRKALHMIKCCKKGKNFALKSFVEQCMQYLFFYSVFYIPGNCVL